jgi:hypothetical protein
MFGVCAASSGVLSCSAFIGRSAMPSMTTKISFRMREASVWRLLF